MQRGPAIPLPVAVWFSFIIHSVVSYDRSVTSSRVSSPQECERVPPLSIYSILSFPQGHPVAGYVSFLVFPPLFAPIFPSMTCFRMQFIRKTWTIQSTFLVFTVCRDIPLLDLEEYFIISHTISRTDLLHPPPTPYFKNFQVFLIYFPKCPCFSTIQSCAPYLALY